jgi:hypothetical protein
MPNEVGSVLKSVMSESSSEVVYVGLLPNFWVAVVFPDLMVLGFISLLLTVFKPVVASLCD